MGIQPQHELCVVGGVGQREPLLLCPFFFLVPEQRLAGGR